MVSDLLQHFYHIDTVDTEMLASDWQHFGVNMGTGTLFHLPYYSAVQASVDKKQAPPRVPKMMFLADELSYAVE